MEIIIFPSFFPGSGVGKCPIYFHITQLKRGYNLQQIFEGDVKQIPEKGHQSQPLHMIIHNCFDQHQPLNFLQKSSFSNIQWGSFSKISGFPLVSRSPRSPRPPCHWTPWRLGARAPARLPGAISGDFFRSEDRVENFVI